MMNIQGENKSLELFNKKGARVYSYYTYSDSSWYERTYDENGNQLTYKNSNGYWHKYTRDDKNGNKLTYKDSDGYWSEYTYDKKGNVLTFKGSDGFWEEYTYDKKGNELTYKNSNGIKRVFDAPEYTMKDLVEKLGNFKLIK